MRYQVECELETITPLFMRGADQRKVEIRSSSIKGVMRWWYRTLAGNCAGNDIKKLENMERNVFGWQDKKSPVKITVETKGSPKPIFLKPHTFDKDSYFPKLSYLWFSIKISANKRDIVYFYPPKTKFRVLMTSLDKDALNKAMVTFWITVTLGGFGFRSRRGAGSVRIVSDNGYFEDIGLPIKLEESFAIENIRDGIEKARNVICPNIDAMDSIKIPSYPVLSPNHSCVSLIKPFEKHPDVALKNFQYRYSSFRKNRKYRERRIVFGLPITSKNSNLGRLNKIKNVIKSSRRASPMIIKVLPVGDMYGLLISKFITEPFYKGEKERDINNFADWSLLYDFDGQLQEDIVFGNPGVFK